VPRAKLQRLIKFGRVTIISPSGRKSTFGADPDANIGPDVTVRAVARLTAIKLALHPDLHYGEAHISGTEDEPWLLSPSC